jgi:hemerythrin superfamily protein
MPDVSGAEWTGYASGGRVAGGITIAADASTRHSRAATGKRTAMAKTPGASERTATEMLMQDHRRVQKLFKDFDKVDRNDEEAVRELVETACLELQIHSMLEEEIFYTAVRAQAATQEMEDLLNEAEVEHESVDELTAKLHELEAGDPMYSAYFKVLAEYVKHHVKKEEQALFPRVEEMKALDLAQLGEDMRLRREELFAEMERAEEEDEAQAELAAPVDDSVPEADDELEDELEERDISRTRH